jgi:anti-anti-sigma factor
MVINQKLNAAKDVILDLEEVPYVSSAGLRIVLMLAKRLGKTQGRFALTSIKPEILSVLRMAGLTSLLTIFDKPEGALQAFGAG